MFESLMAVSAPDGHQSWRLSELPRTLIFVFCAVTQIFESMLCFEPKKNLGLSKCFLQTIRKHSLADKMQGVFHPLFFFW